MYIQCRLTMINISGIISDYGTQGESLLSVDTDFESLSEGIIILFHDTQ